MSDSLSFKRYLLHAKMVMLEIVGKLNVLLKLFDLFPYTFI